MESTVKHQYDGDLALRAPGLAALTADTALTKIDLHRLTAGRGDLENRYGLGSFDVVVVVASMDTTTGDEAYALEFTTYDSAGANPVVQASHTVTSADVAKTRVFTFHPESLKLADADAAKFSINVNVGGTTPIISLYAFAAPHSHA